MIFAAVSRGVLFSLIFCLSRGHCRRYRLLLCRCPRLPDPFVASVLFFPPRDLSRDTFPSPSRRLRRLSRRHRWEQRPFRVVLVRFLRFSLLLLRARLRFLCPSRRKSRRSVLLLFVFLQNRSRPSLFILVLFWSSLFSRVVSSKVSRRASSRRRQRLRFPLQFFRRFPRAFHGDLDVFSRRRRRSSCFWDNSPLTRPIPKRRSALQSRRRRLLTYYY